MATGVLSQPSIGMVNTETRLGADVLAPSLAGDLEKFYDKTDSYDDKAKALELLTSLRLGDSVKENVARRPLTALAAVGTDHQHNFLSPYQTSYNRDYPLKEPIDTVALRPMTSQGFAPQNGPLRETTYTDKFKGRQPRPASPVRSGTASGNRANNPHPPQSFLVWRFPSRSKHEQPGVKWNEELTDDKINQVHKRMCQSTYQKDYMGIPQGFQIKSAYNLPPDWKENIPYTLDSVKRFSYQQTAQPTPLKLPVTRYGSNTNKPIPACGTIPTASRRHMHIRSRTTYDRHYNENADAVTQQIRDLGHKLGAEALKRYYDHSNGEEREMARRMLEAYRGQRVTPTPPPPPVSEQQDMYAARPPSRPQSRSQSRMSLHKGRTPSSTPISAPYVPLPGANPGSARLSDAPYSPPALLH